MDMRDLVRGTAVAQQRKWRPRESLRQHNVELHRDLVFDFHGSPGNAHRSNAEVALLQGRRTAVMPILLYRGYNQRASLSMECQIPAHYPVFGVDLLHRHGLKGNPREAAAVENLRAVHSLLDLRAFIRSKLGVQHAEPARIHAKLNGGLPGGLDRALFNGGLNFVVVCKSGK